MEYTNSLFLANVDKLRKDRNEKVGELETAIGVSIGYFSRLSKNSKTMPGAEVLINLSIHFGVSIDSLLMCNLSSLSEDEEMLSKYLSSLRNATAHGMILWNEENSLLSTRRLEWKSSFKRRNVAYTNGATYITTLSDGSIVKIVPLSGIDFAEERFGGFELYVKEPQSDQWFPICATDKISDMPKLDLRNLYMLIMSNRSKFSMEAGAKNYMLRFLAQNNDSQDTV